ncbi:MAG: IS4 family transposase [Pseudomonadota bacterium]|nr:IS4 family transposase [Pseudomonadota bacterium]
MPETLPEDQKTSSTDFTRSRKLSLPKLITFLLSLVASGKAQGVDGKSGEFFKQARRSGLWPDADAVHRSAVTKARKKLSWRVFDALLKNAVQLAYKIWPDSPEYTWHGMTAIAFDGSKYNLPASDEIRKAFDPESGLAFPGKGHYPQCLVSTAFDVFRRLPIARTISPIQTGNEREDVKTLLPRLPNRPQILLFDRGYPSYDFIHHLTHQNEPHYFVFRCPASSTFKVVEKFVKSGQQEAFIWLDTASHIKTKRMGADQQKSIQLRVVRLESSDGTLSVLITNLLNSDLYTSQSIIELYFRRWRIEEQYRDEKTHLGIETFHSQSVNGIKQELGGLTKRNYQ